MPEKDLPARWRVITQIKGLGFDLRNKLVDGVLAGCVLVLLELLLILLIQPIELVFNRPGVLVYTVVLVAAAVICLERSIAGQPEQTANAWWGVIGGMTGWMAVELSHYLGDQSLLSETGILVFIMAVLTSSVLWRKVAPPGLRYFLLVMLLSWVSHIGLLAAFFMALRFNANLFVILLATGVIAALVFGLTLVSIFWRSHAKSERFNAALVLWAAAMIMIFTFR